jgi:hypothetical protein
VSEPITQLAFGTRVAIEARLERESQYSSTGVGVKKFWNRHMLPATSEGLLIGYRTLSNGTATYGGYEEGISYKSREHFIAAIVVTGPRSKPFYTLPSDIKEWP